MWAVSVLQIKKWIHLLCSNPLPGKLCSTQAASLR